MEYNNIDQKSGRYDHSELILTRSILLSHLFSSEIPPRDVLRHTQKYQEVTYWEELLCAAFYPKGDRLMAVVSRQQLDGYSGILRCQGSIEYVRFFIDWGDDQGYRPLSLSHFKVWDIEQDKVSNRYPVCHLVSVAFDSDYYWRALTQGCQPKVRAILSWNYVPSLDAEFLPAFGNRVDSQICVDSEKDLLIHFEAALQQQPDIKRAEWTPSIVSTA
jgi:hypothetical protein